MLFLCHNKDCLVDVPNLSVLISLHIKSLVVCRSKSHINISLKGSFLANSLPWFIFTDLCLNPNSIKTFAHFQPLSNAQNTFLKLHFILFPSWVQMASPETFR